MKKMTLVRDTIIFTTIVVILALLLSFVKIITQNRINEIKTIELNNAYRQVCDGYDSSIDATDKIINRLIVSRAELINCKIVYDKSKNICGYVVMNKISGYGGKIVTLIGFDSEGNITGIAYPEGLQETPGIGKRVEEEDFKNRFIGKNKQDINDVDTLTGATISSSAVKESAILASDCVSKLINSGE